MRYTERVQRVLGAVGLGFLPLLVATMFATSSLAGTHADHPQRVVILPFANATGEPYFDALSHGFTDVLVSSLSTYDRLVLLERQDLHHVLDELGLSLSAMDTQATQVRVGKQLQATLLIKGSFMRVGAAFTAHAHVVEVATTQLVYSTQQSGTLEGLAALGAAVAADITQHVTRERLQLPFLPRDRKPELHLHFMQGLGYYYSQLFAHAIAEFMQVVHLDPSHAEGRFWIGKSYYDDQAFAHAKIELEAFVKHFPNHRRVGEAQALLHLIRKE